MVLAGADDEFFLRDCFFKGVNFFSHFPILFSYLQLKSGLILFNFQVECVLCLGSKLNGMTSENRLEKKKNFRFLFCFSF